MFLKGDAVHHRNLQSYGKQRVYSKTVTVDRNKILILIVMWNRESHTSSHVKWHNISVLTMDQMKGSRSSDEPTENFHPALLFLSALWGILVSFSSLVLVFATIHLFSFGSVSLLLLAAFPAVASSYFQRKKYTTRPSPDDRQSL